MSDKAKQIAEESPATASEQELAVCSVCGRKTWDEGEVGMTCYIPQPNGENCLGKMVEQFRLSLLQRLSQRPTPATASEPRRYTADEHGNIYRKPDSDSNEAT